MINNFNKNTELLDDYIYCTQEVQAYIHKKTGKLLNAKFLAIKARSYNIKKVGHIYTYTKADIEFIISRMGKVGKVPQYSEELTAFKNKKNKEAGITVI